MYREWKKIEFPKEHYIWISEEQDWDVDQETDCKMKWGRMEEELAEKDGKKKCITERNGRNSREGQGVVTFCTCQWNERILLNYNFNNFVPLAKYNVKTPWGWCRCIETRRSAYDIQNNINIYVVRSLVWVINCTDARYIHENKTKITICLFMTAHAPCPPGEVEVSISDIWASKEMSEFW